MAPATTAGSSWRHADLDQAGQGLPGPVDIIDAPAAEPASVGLLACGARTRPPDRRADRPRGGPVCPRPPAPGRKGRPCWGRSWRCDRQTARSRGSGDRCCGQTRPNRRRDSAWPTSTADPRSMVATDSFVGSDKLAPGETAHRAQGRQRTTDSCRWWAALAGLAGPALRRQPLRHRERGFAGPSATWPCRPRPDKTRWHIRNTSRRARHRPFPPNRPAPSSGGSATKRPPG